MRKHYEYRILIFIDESFFDHKERILLKIQMEDKSIHCIEIQTGIILYHGGYQLAS